MARKIRWRFTGKLDRVGCFEKMLGSNRMIFLFEIDATISASLRVRPMRGLGFVEEELWQ